MYIYVYACNSKLIFFFKREKVTSDRDFWNYCQNYLTYYMIINYLNKVFCHLRSVIVSFPYKA